MFEIMSSEFWFGGIRTTITSSIVIEGESLLDYDGYAIVHHRLSDGTFVYQTGKVGDNGRFFGLFTSRDAMAAYSELYRLVRQ